jgi:glutamyl-tRNA reductase
MVIGAGQMAESCVRLLVKRGARSILISNRSLDRALDLAIRWGGPSSNATERNARAAPVSMRGTFTRVTAGVFTGVSAAAVAFHFR